MPPGVTRSARGRLPKEKFCSVNLGKRFSLQHKSLKIKDARGILSLKANLSHYKIDEHVLIPIKRTTRSGKTHLTYIRRGMNTNKGNGNSNSLSSIDNEKSKPNKRKQFAKKSTANAALRHLFPEENLVNGTELNGGRNLKNGGNSSPPPSKRARCEDPTEEESPKTADKSNPYTSSISKSIFQQGSSDKVTEKSAVPLQSNATDEVTDKSENNNKKRLRHSERKSKDDTTERNVLSERNCSKNIDASHENNVEKVKRIAISLINDDNNKEVSLAPVHDHLQTPKKSSSEVSKLDVALKELSNSGKDSAKKETTSDVKPKAISHNDLSKESHSTKQTEEDELPSNSSSNQKDTSKSTSAEESLPTITLDSCKDPKNSKPDDVRVAKNSFSNGHGESMYKMTKEDSLSSCSKEEDISKGGLASEEDEVKSKDSKDKENTLLEEKGSESDVSSESPLDKLIKEKISHDRRNENPVKLKTVRATTPTSSVTKHDYSLSPNLSRKRHRSASPGIKLRDKRVVANPQKSARINHKDGSVKPKFRSDKLKNLMKSVINQRKDQQQLTNNTQVGKPVKNQSPNKTSVVSARGTTEKGQKIAKLMKDFQLAAKSTSKTSSPHIAAKAKMSDLIEKSKRTISVTKEKAAKNNRGTASTMQKALDVEMVSDGELDFSDDSQEKVDQKTKADETSKLDNLTKNLLGKEGEAVKQMAGKDKDTFVILDEVGYSLDGDETSLSSAASDKNPQENSNSKTAEIQSTEDVAEIINGKASDLPVIGCGELELGNNLHCRQESKPIADQENKLQVQQDSKPLADKGNMDSNELSTLQAQQGEKLIPDKSSKLQADELITPLVEQEQKTLQAKQESDTSVEEGKKVPAKEDGKVLLDQGDAPLTDQESMLKAEVETTSEACQVLQAVKGNSPVNDEGSKLQTEQGCLSQAGEGSHLQIKQKIQLQVEEGETLLADQGSTVHSDQVIQLHTEQKGSLQSERPSTQLVDQDDQKTGPTAVQRNSQPASGKECKLSTDQNAVPTYIEPFTAMPTSEACPRTGLVMEVDHSESQGNLDEPTKNVKNNIQKEGPKAVETHDMETQTYQILQESSSVSIQEVNRIVKTLLESEFQEKEDLRKRLAKALEERNEMQKLAEHFKTELEKAKLQAKVANVRNAETNTHTDENGSSLFPVIIQSCGCQTDGPQPGSPSLGNSIDLTKSSSAQSTSSISAEKAKILSTLLVQNRENFKATVQNAFQSSHSSTGVKTPSNASQRFGTNPSSGDKEITNKPVPGISTRPSTLINQSGASPEVKTSPNRVAQPATHAGHSGTPPAKRSIIPATSQPKPTNDDDVTIIDLTGAEDHSKKKSIITVTNVTVRNQAASNYSSPVKPPLPSKEIVQNKPSNVGNSPQQLAHVQQRTVNTAQQSSIQKQNSAQSGASMQTFRMNVAQNARNPNKVLQPNPQQQQQQQLILQQQHTLPQVQQPVQQQRLIVTQQQLPQQQLSVPQQQQPLSQPIFVSRPANPATNSIIFNSHGQQQFSQQPSTAMLTTVPAASQANLALLQQMTNSHLQQPMQNSAQQQLQALILQGNTAVRAQAPPYNSAIQNSNLARANAAAAAAVNQARRSSQVEVANTQRLVTTQPSQNVNINTNANKGNTTVNNGSILSVPTIPKRPIGGDTVSAQDLHEKALSGFINAKTSRLLELEQVERSLLSHYNSSHARGNFTEAQKYQRNHHTVLREIGQLRSQIQEAKTKAVLHNSVTLKNRSPEAGQIQRVSIQQQPSSVSQGMVRGQVVQGINANMQRNTEQPPPNRTIISAANVPPRSASGKVWMPPKSPGMQNNSPRGTTTAPSSLPTKYPHPASLPVLASAATDFGLGTQFPPQPSIRITHSSEGVVLSWNINPTQKNSTVKKYLLYAYQVLNAPPSTSLWKKIGDVEALAPPMACTLNQFQPGSTYHLAICAVDVYGRVGPFSETEEVNIPLEKPAV